MGALWFLDLKFTRFVSATIIRIVWSVFLALGTLGVVLAGVGMILSQPILQALLLLVLMVLGFGFLALLFRVWLEAFMVIFRMAEHLRQMNEKLASR